MAEMNRRHGSLPLMLAFRPTTSIVRIFAIVLGLIFAGVAAPAAGMVDYVQRLPPNELGMLIGLLAPFFVAFGWLAWRRGRVMYAGAALWALLETLRLALAMGSFTSTANTLQAPSPVTAVTGMLFSFLVIMLIAPAILAPARPALNRLFTLYARVQAAAYGIALLAVYSLGMNSTFSIIGSAWCAANGLGMLLLALHRLKEVRGGARVAAATWGAGFAATTFVLLIQPGPIFALINTGDGLWIGVSVFRLLSISVGIVVMGILEPYDALIESRTVLRTQTAPTGVLASDVAPALNDAFPHFTFGSPMQTVVEQEVLSASQPAVQSDQEVSRRLEEALMQLSQAADLHRQMGSLMSHELRAPLSTISAAAQSLELILSGSGELVDGRIARIRRSVGRMSELLDTFFDAERAKSGPLAPMTQNVDLVELAARVIAAQQTEAAHHLVLDAPEAIIARCDPSLCAVVLRNLLHNAIKYSPANRPIVVKIRMHEQDGNPTCVLSVIDMGAGMEPSELLRIFDRHYRRPSHREVKGTGIGLSLARKLCEHQDGSLEVESAIGVGSSFTVTLPAARLTEV